jgi:Reverse transcriptase (RNA-dependent DNA polymerase)
VANRILSRAQKGFLPGRYIQECIINLVETINYCEKNKIEAFVLALDMAKAFDSIRQDYLTEVYKFFGFGEKMIKIINVFTTGRKACIFLEDDTVSQDFDLDLGSTQGNAPSPLQFNFGEQILLFKIELDVRIISVFNNNVNIHIHLRLEINVQFNINERGVSRYESRKETNKVEGFADDASAIAKANEGSIIAIKDDLSDFETLSGLKCNVDKSLIMPIGCEEGNIPEAITSSGFKMVDQITVLGVKITKKYDDITENFNNCIRNIIGICNFWGRFNLSLQGRIAICKTFMLSQLG